MWEHSLRVACAHWANEHIFTKQHQNKMLQKYHFGTKLWGVVLEADMWPNLSPVFTPVCQFESNFFHH